jgi:polysaccharide biosynthesis/export protein
MRGFGQYLGVVMLAGLAFAPALRAQAAPVDVRRAQATRSELEAALTELDQAAASPGYSKSYRKAREAEAAMVRQRLAEGDFQVGDQVDLVVVGEAALSGKFTVLPDRSLSLPALPPVSLQGVLRSELPAHLTTEIGKYVKDPQVTVQGSYIRLAIMGMVGKPGYYTVPADNLISDAIMDAGGPGQGVDMSKSIVRRAGKPIIVGDDIQRAIESGESLDQLNVHGGDELVVGGKSQKSGGGFNMRNVLWPVQLALSLTFLATRIF